MVAVLGLGRGAPLQVSELGIGREVEGGGKLLNGRQLGQQVFDKIIEHFDHQPPDVVVSLSFQGIVFVDISCADEIACRLMKRIKSGEMQGKFLILTDLEESVREIIAAALDQQDLCCLAELPGRLEILGRISGELRQTYEFAASKGFVSTGDIQTHFRLKMSAASNRLVRLEESGLVYRVANERGGRSFTYQAVA